MEEHEKVCWKNPKNRTCKTCQHEIYNFDKTTYDYPGEGWTRECKDAKGKELVEILYGAIENKYEIEYQEEIKEIETYGEILLGQHPKRKQINDKQIPPVIHCPYHKLKK